MIAVSCGSATATGPVRKVNEDSLLAVSPLFVVADGMGGHTGGDVASQLVVETFGRLARAGTVTVEDVRDALGRANALILQASWEQVLAKGMGTTAVGLAIVSEGSRPGRQHWLAFNIGDSRLYRYFAGELERVSVDHSVVEELVDKGEITEAQRWDHPRSNIITRVLGSDPAPVADFWMLKPIVDERFLLCTDGLHKELGDGGIRDLLALALPPGQVAAMLVRDAIAAGGRDNVTAVVVDVDAVDVKSV